MRTLNKKQKKLLTEAHKEHGCTSVWELPYEVWEQVEEVNNHETIYQNIDRFLSDLYFDSIYK